MKRSQKTGFLVAIPFLVFYGVLLLALWGDGHRDLRAAAIVVAAVLSIAVSASILVAARRRDR